MPIISRFFGIAIVLYWNDHAPPHFHAKYGGQEVVIEIKTGRIMKGSLSKRATSLVQQWRRGHVRQLIEDWDLARSGQPLKYIEPLE